ncbi:hypothetical protein ACPCG0_10010 [Propionibacteriaceae bacterium Y1923]|uniref:hypothetical protein n=1 Tax=Aestuariimicrobium sp. Y1814 TaxID=3418742 RepID=UPI003C15D745
MTAITSGDQREAREQGHGSGLVDLGVGVVPAGQQQRQGDHATQPPCPGQQMQRVGEHHRPAR